MLDLIEYLSQWLRAPVLQVCLARDELLERRPGWGASRRTTTSLFLDPLRRRRHARADRRAAARRRRRTASVLEAARRARRGQPAVRRGDGAAARRGRRRARPPSCPTPCRGCWPRGWIRWRRWSASSWRTRPSSVGPSGRVRSRRSRRRRGATCRTALLTLREKDIIVPGEGARLADEQELAFKHVLIRDVAYEMLPKSVRARKHFEVGVFIERRAGERRHEVVALLAEHYGRAATLGEEVQLEPDELAPLRSKALQFLEAAGDAASALYSNQEALAHYRARRRAGSRRSGSAGAHPREAGRPRAAAGAGRRCDRGVGAGSRLLRASRRISSTSPSCTARSARRWRTRASARRRSSTTSRGST